MVNNTLKNRYAGTEKYKRFVIGVDRQKMQLFDVEDDAQTLADNGIPEEESSVFDNSAFGRAESEREKKEKYKTLFGEP